MTIEEKCIYEGDSTTLIDRFMAVYCSLYHRRTLDKTIKAVSRFHCHDHNMWVDDNVCDLSVACSSVDFVYEYETFHFFDYLV